MRSNLFISCSLPSLGIQCRYISVILCGRVASSSDGGRNQANVIVYGQSGKKTPITVIKNHATGAKLGKTRQGRVWLNFEFAGWLSFKQLVCSGWLVMYIPLF